MYGAHGRLASFFARRRGLASVNRIQSGTSTRGPVQQTTLGSDKFPEWAGQPDFAEDGLRLLSRARSPIGFTTIDIPGLRETPGECETQHGSSRRVAPLEPFDKM